MKTLRKNGAAWFAALALLAGGRLAADTPSGHLLTVGDPAPAMQTGQWVRGQPVTDYLPGKGYLIDFWATWSAASLRSIPRVNELNSKYKRQGLVVVGLDCLERDDEGVAPFLKKMGTNMSYAVALDDKSGSKTGKMAESWVAAAGRHNVPVAFLIDTKGIIAWIGSPAELDNDFLEQVLNGKYDLQKAAAAYEQAVKDRAERQKEMAPALDKMNALYSALRAQKWAEAETDLNQAERLTPTNRRPVMQLDFAKARFVILLGKRDATNAYKVAERLSDAFPTDARLQDYLAREIAMYQVNGKPNVALAAKLADRANTAAKGAIPEVLDTQAMVQFLQGQKDAAIQTETKAVSLADPERQAAFQSRLDSYKKGQMPAQN